jgi:hypothetical protein
MSDHEETAARLEREADDMEHRGRQIDDDIEAAREDWERKKADDNVPGAAGEPSRAEGGLPPEANYTQSGDDPPGDDGGRMPPPEPDETD